METPLEISDRREFTEEARRAARDALYDLAAV